MATPPIDPAPAHATLDGWIAGEAIPFSVDAPEGFDAAVDRVVAALGDGVEVLGLGEPLHGGEGFLVLRNRLFRRLVEAHGYRAIALESSFPRARVVDGYVAGRGPASSDAVREAGFSHGFGALEANRELVEWMRGYNADPDHRVTLRFYGFDSPTEYGPTDSPRQTLHAVLDFLASVDPASAAEHRRRIDPLLGQDAAWENPAALGDPTQAFGRSPAAAALRVATEDLVSDLRLRRPEWVAKGDAGNFLEALQYASVARQLLTYHAALARASETRGMRAVDLMGVRDAMMADNLAYAADRERGRGKVLAFTHNSHLRRGKAEWPLGTDLLTWWPAGAHLDAELGPRYAVIGMGVGVSEANGIGEPEAGTLEARLTAAPGPARFIPTHRGQGLPAAEVVALPTRSGTPAYFPLTPRDLADFDGLAVLDETAYARGAPWLLQTGAGSEA